MKEVFLLRSEIMRRDAEKEGVRDVIRGREILGQIRNRF